MSRGSHVILNGELLPRERAHIDIDDLGFLIGDGVFETLRMYGGVPFLLEEHVARLFASLRVVDLEIPWSRDQLLAQVRLVVERNELLDGSGRLRITVTRGPGTPPSKPRGAPTILMTADPWEPLDALVYERGVSIEASRHVRHAQRWNRVKSTSYQSHLVLKREASSADIFEVVQWNDAGYLTEGSFTSVFVVDTSGVLHTPHARDGCLKGVTRNAVLTIAGQTGMHFHEGEVSHDVVEAAREIFLTGSLIEIVPVRCLDGRDIGDACPGPTTRALRTAYRSFVSSVVGHRSWDPPNNQS
jgi:branched-chain amino acid aminotransferase